MMILSQDESVLYDTASGPISIVEASEDEWEIVGLRSTLGTYKTEEEAKNRLRAIGQRADVLKL